jgi:EmrB/QacA subfamily drug resistance transporter
MSHLRSNKLRDAVTNSAFRFGRADDRPLAVLAVLCAADFLVVLDGLVVAVALPDLQQTLAISAGALQWTVTSYVLCLGGFLLLGGRMGDIYGRRRLLVAGLVVFAAGSLLAGLAWTPLVLFAGRAVQGLGAAAMAPTALALLTTTFTDPAARNRALGVWSAVGSAGIPVGALLGGALTATVGWRWVFLVNVVAALAAAVATRVVVRDGTADDAPDQLDWAGAVLVTGGLSLVIAGISQAEHANTLPVVATRVAAPVALGAVLLAAFVLVERRAKAPLVPLEQLRAPGQLPANLVGLVLPVGLGAALFLTTLHLQRVQGLGPLATGAAYLALAAPCVAASPLASRLAARWGRRITASAGLLLQLGGLLLLARASVDDSLATVIVGFMLIGLGAPIAFVPTTAAAMDSPGSDPGLASGIFNTSQQLGNAVALAAIATLAASWTARYGGADVGPAALTAGYSAGFLLAAAIVLLGLLPAIRLDVHHNNKTGALSTQLPSVQVHGGSSC